MTKAKPNNDPSQSLKPALTVISINIEGFSKAKGEILATLCQESQCDILCVQETHRDTHHQRPEIPGMTLSVETPHAKHGSAIFVRPNVHVQSASHRSDSSIEILTINTGRCTVTSVYKPPKEQFKFQKTENFDDQPIKIIVGDFNSHSTAWGYSKTNSDGDLVEEWADAENLTLVHNAKLPASFNSCRWRRGYNPDLIFSSANIASLCRKSVCSGIPNTQHRPIVCHVEVAIKPQTVPFRRRFNFLKEQFSETIDNKLNELYPVFRNYEEFVNIVWSVSRRYIPRGCRTTYVPGLNEDTSSLLKEYQRSYERDPFSEETIRVGEELTCLIGENRKERWMSLVTSIDMTHNSKKAWRTIQKLTDDPPLPNNPGQVTANQVAHQLLLNGKPPHRLPRTEKPIDRDPPTDNISKPFTLT